MDGSDILRSDRRKIEDLPWMKVVSEIYPRSAFQVGGGWAFCIQLNDSASGVPARFCGTRWWILADQTYPWGDVAIMPAQKGGFTETYPHQRLNESSPGTQVGVPWRPGTICLHDAGWVHDTQRLTEEPVGKEGRLGWLMERLLVWVQAAATGAWFQPGQRFEFPDFAPVDQHAPPFLFLEDATSFRHWQSLLGQSGLVKLRPWGRSTVLRSFHTQDGKAAIAPAWAPAIDRQGEGTGIGIWVALPSIPVISPWKAPMTGEEIASALSPAGLNMEALAHRKDLRTAFAGQTLTVAVGFPVGENHSASIDRMAWRVFVESLPFERRIRRDPVRFSPILHKWWSDPNRRVGWRSTENVSSVRFNSRGLLPPPLRGGHVALVGCGSLGSQIAESLARGGASRLLLIDPKHFLPANLVRHTLDCSSLEIPKVQALRRRIEQISPTCDTMSFPGDLATGLHFQDILNKEDVDIVVDTSASDEVRALLGRSEANRPRWLIRMEFTAGVTRGYLTIYFGRRFNDKTAVDGMEKFENTDVGRNSKPDVPMAMEEVGCWSEVFPARHSQVTFMANLLWEDAQREVADGGKEGSTTVAVRYQDKDGNKVNDWSIWTWRHQDEL